MPQLTIPSVSELRLGEPYTCSFKNGHLLTDALAFSLGPCVAKA